MLRQPLPADNSITDEKKIMSVFSQVLSVNVYLGETAVEGHVFPPVELEVIRRGKTPRPNPDLPRVGDSRQSVLTRLHYLTA